MKVDSNSPRSAAFFENLHERAHAPETRHSLTIIIVHGWCAFFENLRLWVNVLWVGV